MEVLRRALPEVKVEAYHAGMSAQVRNDVHTNFLTGETHVSVKMSDAEIPKLLEFSLSLMFFDIATQIIVATVSNSRIAKSFFLD